MVGITDLKVLLKSMEPKPIKGEFVFCTVSEEHFTKLRANPLLVFREKEGITLILERDVADANSLPYSHVWGMITLTVHSDLTAVGFLAVITSKLAGAGISVNVVSAYYHDHLFIPLEKVDKAMELLRELSSSSLR